LRRFLLAGVALFVFGEIDLSTWNYL
jgi:hypothetical protein